MNSVLPPTYISETREGDQTSPLVLAKNPRDGERPTSGGISPLRRRRSLNPSSPKSSPPLTSLSKSANLNPSSYASLEGPLPKSPSPKSPSLSPRMSRSPSSPTQNSISTPSPTFSVDDSIQEEPVKQTENTGAAVVASSLWYRILHPTGVRPTHRVYEHWVGKIGFGAKGLVYGFVGGMTCASARRIYGNVNGSPQGAFVLIGDFPAGHGLLVVMLIALMCYIGWRWWECFTFQGADATFSPAKNFFAYRLSPFVSGAVYIAYSYYIIDILANTNTQVCYPNCWRDSTIGRIALALFGIAFAIACITQLQNALTKKWHPEINWGRCSVFEKWMLLVLGHVGFLGRAGLFVFVSVLMFRALVEPVPITGNTIANGINQFVGDESGRFFMYVVGILTATYGLFALLCTRYRYFPTPPPSGIPLFAHPKDDEEAGHVTLDNRRAGDLVIVRNSSNSNTDIINSDNNTTTTSSNIKI